MVALDGNKEFELRRRIRIQQVRQQSKRIAEDVRNKVRREKNRQLNKLGNEAQEEFKEKQNKKLTCLKQHYKGCLADFGQAFGDAENEPDPSEEINRLNEENRHQAELRGKCAEQKRQEDKEEQDKEKNKRAEDMKYARYVENVRSKLVSDLPKSKRSKKKWKKCLADIHINGEFQNVLDDSTYDSDIFDLSVLDEDTNENTSEFCDEECKSDCNSRDDSILNQENDIDDDTTENNQKDENRSRGGKELHIPLCLSKENTGKENYPHEKYKSKNKPHKASQRLVAIADSLKKIAEEYKEESVEPCIGAPCEKVLTNMMEAATSTISNKIRQRIQSSESSSKENLICYCEPKNSIGCSTCNFNLPIHKSEGIQVSRNGSSGPKWYSKYNPQRSELDLSENNFLEAPERPVLTSEPISPTKRKSVKKRHSNSPDKFPNLQSFRKMLISSKNVPHKDGTDFQNECLEVVSPIKVLHSRRKSPKKLNKKKSSLHDSNYCLPTVPKTTTNKRCFPDIEYQLPNVPTTIIRPDTEMGTKQSNVKYYDHFNRFSKEEFQPALVQKISKESIDIIPDDVSDVQSTSILCKKRDQEAKMRGNKALEKVKIHQDYQKLLQELPVLQRQERLANMPMHNPSLHMSNERYQEYERKKQNAMENKFENIQSKAVQFDKPPITLKSVRKSPPSSGTKEPLKTLDVTDENTILNVGTWENANSTGSSEQKTTNEESNQNPEIAIADLLKRVNKQRELLLKEAVSMKSLGGLKDILNEEELINIICNCPPRQKVLVEMGTSPLNKNLQCSESSKERSSSSRLKSPKRSAVSSSDTSVETSRPKTPKIRPKVKKLKVYLREEATQTSPLLSKKPSKNIVIPSNKKEGYTQTSVTSHSLTSSKSKIRRPKSQRSVSSAKSLVTSKNTRPESSSDKSDKVCEIIIRTGDQNVKINPISTTSKKDSPKKDVVIKIKEGKGESQQKNMFDMSTSTSYMSPPIEIKSREKPCPADASVVEICRPSNRHLLQPQRQQTNLDNLVRVENGAKEINPRLIKYIMRLLNMSRQSIDELTISSVSDVSTPQDSIVQTANNLAKEKLQTVMDHFHLSADDIKKICLSSSSLSDITTEIRQVEEKLRKESSNTAANIKQYTCTAPCSEKNESTQVCFEGKQSASTISEEEKYLGEKREKDFYASTSSGYRGSKSRSPPISTSSQRKDFSSVCPEKQDSKSTGQETKDTSRPTTSPTNIRHSSSKSTTVKSTTVSPKSTCIKVALPKLDSTSEPCSTLPSSMQQTNIQKASPKSPIILPKNQQVIPKYCGTTDTTSSEEAMLKNPDKFLQFVRESLGMTVEEFSELGFEEMFSRHMELTEYCHDRIRSLMSLIEQIRNEKREICSSASPVDHSMTSYLDLPPSKSKQTNVKDTTDPDKEYGACVQSCLENDISSGSSISQEAIDKYLLGIGQDIELKRKRNEEKQKEKSPEHIRLQSGECKDQRGPPQSFVPMLQGIPKYSETSTVDSKMPSFLGDLLHQMRPKPPPALLRSNMKGHTNETPHELSTIAEADTIISSRNTSMHRPRTPEERIPSKDISPRPIYTSPVLMNSPNKIERNKSLDQSNSTNSSAAYVTISPDRTLCSDETKNKLNKVGLIETLCTSESTQETGTKSGLSGIHSLSETSQETPDELESLLRKFKLEWAISLVKKTEQALALSSSSSSSDVRGIKDVSSDISIRDSFRQLCKKLAILNDSDIERAQIVSDLTNHFREFHDISEIPGVADSKNKSHQRTSTPVQHSKSTESKKSITNESLFKVDSELSSVKNNSDENNDQLFLSIPNVTLNTEHISLMKS